MYIHNINFAEWMLNLSFSSSHLQIFLLESYMWYLGVLSLEAAEGSEHYILL
jgi:hypothetical protein